VAIATIAAIEAPAVMSVVMIVMMDTPHVALIVMLAAVRIAMIAIAVEVMTDVEVVEEEAIQIVMIVEETAMLDARLVMLLQQPPIVTPHLVEKVESHTEVRSALPVKCVQSHPTPIEVFGSPAFIDTGAFNCPLFLCFAPQVRAADGKKQFILGRLWLLR